MPLTDTSSADTNITAAPQITRTDTASADTNIIAATRSQLDTLSGPLQTRSPLWRALRQTHRRLRTVADGCERKRKTWRTQPHPQTPKWNGNPRYAFGKKSPTACQACVAQLRVFTPKPKGLSCNCALFTSDPERIQLRLRIAHLRSREDSVAVAHCSLQIQRGLSFRCAKVGSGVYIYIYNYIYILYIFFCQSVGDIFIS